MTPQEVIKKFMAKLAASNYSSSTSFKKSAFNAAVKASSNFTTAQKVIDSMKADQIKAEQEAVEEILGSEYAGKTISEIDSSILKASAKNYDGTKISKAYTSASKDNRSTVEKVIKERKAYIFLEKYCGIQLGSKFYINSSGNVISSGSSGNTDTGAITGSDANITLQAGDVVDGVTLTTDLMKVLALQDGISIDGENLIVGSGTKKTATSVVPEEIVNTYTATTSAAQIIKTNSRDWIVKATSANDTITSNGADSINAGAGNDVITANKPGATITSGDGNDSIKISSSVKDLTITDLSADDTLTINGTFKIGSAVIEDELLVITDKTGTRKVRFDNFMNSTDSTVKIGTTSTTFGKWLTDADIDINDLEKTTYAESIGVNPATTSTDSTASNVKASDDGDSSDVVTVNLADVNTSKAGNVSVNGAIVGKTSSSYPNDTTFTRNGLTIHLLGELTNETVLSNISSGLGANSPMDSKGTSLITPLTYDDLSTNQKTIIAGIFKWWGNECLTLSEESFGLSFNSGSPSINDIGLYFYDGQGKHNVFATVWNWIVNSTSGLTNKLMLSINLDYYKNLSATDVDGKPSGGTASLLDRTLAHELTHAIMSTNIRHFNYLPKFIKEGSAELVHGIDDKRGIYIFREGYDATYLANSLNLSEYGGSGNNYAGGYVFLRYFAKQAALQTLFDDVNFDAVPFMVIGTDAADSINNTLESATVQALGGNDTITNSADNVRFIYGGGNDLIQGFNATSTLQIGDGSEDYSLTTNGQDNVIIVGDASITLEGTANFSALNIDGNNLAHLTLTNKSATKTTIGSSIETVDASARTKAARIVGNALDNTITGGKGNDYLFGKNGDDCIDGGKGNDYLSGGNGNDTLRGSEGNDKLYGNDGDDYLYGDAGNDKIFGQDGNDYLYGNDGNDTLSGGNGSDYLAGGYGNDSIVGGANNDTLWAGAGNDKLLGGSGNDSLVGGSGKDKLYGQDGNDTLSGGTGNDSLWGGNGSDTFLYSKGDGKDIIYGFSDNDLLKITGTFSASYSKSKGEVYFKVGNTSKAITLHDFTATSFSVNDSTYHINSKNKFVKS